MKFSVVYQKIKAFWNRYSVWIIILSAICLTLFLSTLHKIRQNQNASQIARAASHISKYDGSHRKLEAYIKHSMNDPSSYQHISTTFVIPKDSAATSAIYKTTFRGKNAFGAVVIQTIIAKCNLQTGEVESILSN